MDIMLAISRIFAYSLHAYIFLVFAHILLVVNHNQRNTTGEVARTATKKQFTLYFIDYKIKPNLVMKTTSHDCPRSECYTVGGKAATRASILENLDVSAITFF